MALKTKTKKASRTSKMTAGQFFEIVATKVGLKKKVAKDVVYAMVETTVETLLKNGEVKIPHLAKFMIKDIPEKKIPAGNYVNLFKKGPDGKPVTEYREARVRPARRKIKVSVSSQVKKPLAK